MARDESKGPAQPVHELSREVARLLEIASDENRLVSEVELRDALDLSAKDLRGILEQLRERGRAAEEAPGEWTAHAAEPVRVTVSEESQEEPEEETSWQHDLTERLVAREATLVAPTIRLTQRVAKALSAEALGQLVVAGIDEAAERGEAFTMEVSE